MIEEQENVKQRGYTEAMRYIANAKDVLARAGMEDGHYKDRKYVRMACGTAYGGVLEALDTWLELKGIEVPIGRKSIKFYKENISKLDKKMTVRLNGAYDTLHLAGYYDGNLNPNIIKEGFKEAMEIISSIKPVQGASL